METEPLAPPRHFSTLPEYVYDSPPVPKLAGEFVSSSFAHDSYYVETTYVSASGESFSTKEQTIQFDNQENLIVPSPPPMEGATGYNVYVGRSSGSELLINATPISIGTDWNKGGTTPVPTSDFSPPAQGRGNLTQVIQKITTGTVTTENAELFTYLGTGTLSGGKLASISLVRKTLDSSLGQTDASTPFTPVEEVVFSYYGSGSANGESGDLEMSVTNDTEGNILDLNYYRYYTNAGPIGRIKYILGLDSYSRLGASLSSGTIPLTATDAQIAPYADTYYTYDASGRVATRVLQGEGCSACSGGLGSFSFAYGANSNALGYNTWANKTTETLPDGTVETYYFNGYGEQMLEVKADPVTGLSYGSFIAYDGAGRAVMSADPTAVELPSTLSTLESYPDLLDQVGGNYTYLSDNSGEIDFTNYYASTTATSSASGSVAGYVENTTIQQGEEGMPDTQEAFDYIAHTAGATTIYPVADDTVYSDTSAADPRTTSISYSWYSSSTQIKTATETMPNIGTGEDGPNSADTQAMFYDSQGRLIWIKDGNGNVSYASYDDATGALVRQITNVVYASLSAAEKASFDNTGWTDPTGGLNLVTADVVDNQGRITKETDPNGNITYIVYDDADEEVRVYPGFDPSTGTTSGPIEISRDVLPSLNSGGLYYSETMTSSALPHLTGGVPDGTESLNAGNIQSLERDFTNAAGQVLWSDSYANMSGVVFSEGVGLSGGAPTDLGASGSNFYRTTYAYDDDGRQDKMVEPTGTIDRTVFDGLGRIVSQWVGTDDTPTTGYWSPTNLTGTNMVDVADYVYDDGNAGDGNVTQMTQKVDSNSAHDRVTQYAYDWRNRLVETKSGVQGTEDADTHRPITYITYDNLDEPVEQETYDGDTVQLSDLGSTDGMPNAPDASLLRAKSTASYDDQGRVYRTNTFSIDPSDGSGSSSIGVRPTNHTFCVRPTNHTFAPAI